MTESTYSFPRSDPAPEIDLLSPKPKGNNDEKSSNAQSKKEEHKEAKVEPEVVSKFFKRLSDETEAENPLEEMFRLFGGDLCTQHPENCERYLKSYKDVRSKTSHLSSLRDNVEFEKLDGEIQEMHSITPPQQFSMSKSPFMTNYHKAFFSTPSTRSVRLTTQYPLTKQRLKLITYRYVIFFF